MEATTHMYECRKKMNNPMKYKAQQFVGKSKNTIDKNDK